HVSSLLVVKKLRYYARFIVVSLLLNRRKLVSGLVDELQVLVDAYIKTFKPSDAAAWRLVLQEINLFLQVDRPLVLLDKSKDAPPISNRLNLPPSTLEGKPKLQEAILVGNCQNQVKFSELTLDMFRIMQVLEREQGIVSRLPEPEDLEGSAHRPVNPHKFLLYRPSFSQLYVFLSTAFKELSDNNVLLLYLSADSLSGDFHNDESKEKDKDKQALGDVVYRKGGLAMSSTVLSSSPDSLEEPEQAPESPYGLYPEDLIPFTRKKMFVIVESGNSLAFKSIQNVFGKPFLFLLSPTRREYGGEQRGNLFTLFLSAPLSAFCFMVGKTSVPQDTYEKCEKSLSNSFEDVHKLLCNFESIPPAFHDFIEEDFLQSFILRFIFCYSVLYLHKSYQSKAAESLPQSHPMLPMDFLSHPVVLSIVYKLASFLQVTDQFGQP
ncbi:Protein SCAI,Protein SCAI, partial [Balamuthia mandrillaris]